MTRFQLPDVDQRLAQRIKERAKQRGQSVNWYLHELVIQDLESEPFEQWLQGSSGIAKDIDVDVDAMIRNDRDT